MNQLVKAQITIGLLACFAISVAFFQNISTIETIIFAFAKLIAVFILAIVLLGLLEWVKIFDLKTNAILTLVVLVTLPISYVIVV